jgi:Domain of unknown function (DUF4806)
VTFYIKNHSNKKLKQALLTFSQKRILHNRMDGIEGDFKHLFRIIFADSILKEYNWSGQGGRKAINQLKIVWSIMLRKTEQKIIILFVVAVNKNMFCFSAFFRDNNPTYGDAKREFIKNMKTQLVLASSRVRARRNRHRALVAKTLA